MENDAKKMREYRKMLDDLILSKGGKVTRRFYALDNQAYEDGAIPKEYKEMMGLVASLVLLCEECVFYHLDQCVKLGVTDEEFDELFGIALVVGGSVVIPKLRVARDLLVQIRKEG